MYDFGTAKSRLVSLEGAENLTIADSHRWRAMKHAASLTSFRNSWPSFQPELLGHLGASPGGTDVFDLGGKLESVFRSNVVPGRSNQVVSIGGAAWEALVLWYLNLVFCGTDVVVVKPVVKLTPPTIRDALSVTISNHKTNTEADLIAFSIPEPTDSAIEIQLNEHLALAQIDRIIAADTTKIDVTVVQCKTNWNDNAQIPMLWDLIYGANNFRIPGVSVGVNGQGPSIFRNFSYAFVTVPTSSGALNATSMPVLRVHGLTGGNYWGRPSSPGVSGAASEFFQRNFGSHFHGSVQNSIDRALQQDSSLLQRFLSLSF